jgi:hypothetical protein
MPGNTPSNTPKQHTPSNIPQEKLTDDRSWAAGGRLVALTPFDTLQTGAEGQSFLDSVQSRRDVQIEFSHLIRHRCHAHFRREANVRAGACLVTQAVVEDAIIFISIVPRTHADVLFELSIPREDTVASAEGVAVQYKY